MSNKYLEKLAELSKEELQNIWGNAHWHTEDDVDAATNTLIDAGISPDKAFNMSNRQLRRAHNVAINTITSPEADKPGKAIAGITTGLAGALGGAVLGNKLMGEPGSVLGAIGGLIGGGIAGSSAYHALRREAYEKADEEALAAARANLEKFRAKVESLGAPAGADREVVNKHTGSITNHNINYDNTPFHKTQYDGIINHYR